MKTKNTVLYYHDLSLVHETKKFGTQIILPLSDTMFVKGKKFSGGESPLEKNTKEMSETAFCFKDYGPTLNLNLEIGQN